MSEWISVDDENDLIPGYCLCINEHNDYHVGYLSISDRVCVEESVELHDVTHWMSLPGPP